MALILQLLVGPLVLAGIIYLIGTTRATITYRLDSVFLLPHKLKEAGFKVFEMSPYGIYLTNIKISNNSLRHIENVKLHIGGGTIFLHEVKKQKRYQSKILN